MTCSVLHTSFEAKISFLTILFLINNCFHIKCGNMNSKHLKIDTYAVVYQKLIKILTFTHAYTYLIVLMNRL